jgi:hypothetical protein
MSAFGDEACVPRPAGGFHQLYCALLVSMALSAESVLAQPFRMQVAPPAAPSLEARQAFQTRIDEQASLLASDPRLKHFSQQERRAAVEFTVGNVLIAALHQLGLALLSELSLPAVGGVDQGADDFAVLTALELGKSHFSDRVLMDAAKGRFTSVRNRKAARDLSRDDPALNVRRAYRMVCLMVGADAVRFNALAEDTALPKNLQRNCGWDYDNAVRSWGIVVRPHRPRADQPKTQVDVNYGVAAGKLEVYAQLFRNLGFLETLAEVAASQVNWPAPLRFEMRSCGDSPATWNASTRTLSICYEAARGFAERYLEQKGR